MPSLMTYTSKEDILKDLNPEQKKAVVHDEGPLLVIAGAGTGKTTVIIRRIAHLIATKKAKPSEILALTFTDKAADEMENRVDLLVPYGYIDVSISTFHAFGDRVLREHALDLNIKPDYRVLSHPEQVVFFREHLFQFPLNHYRSLADPTKHIEALLQVISRAKDEDVTPEEYLEFVKKELKRTRKTSPQYLELEKQLEVAKVYEKYQSLKMDKGFVDFGDQVNLTLKLFRKHPDVLSKFQKRYRYILVDEFQDTNYAQFELLKLLANKHKNLIVVGDDDQSIYKFRGAAISNILNFEKTYKNCKKVVLVRNYRSSQILLDSAYRLIRHNNPERLEVKSKVNKKLLATKSGGEEDDIVHKHFDRVTSEADWVARKIRELYEKRKYKFKDFAILVRSNIDAEPFKKSLNMLGIPFQFSGASNLYAFPEVKLALSFLKILGDLSDSISLYDLSLSQVYKLDPVDLQKLNTFAQRRNYTLYDVFSNLPSSKEEYGVLDISKDSRERVEKIIGDVHYYLKFAREHTTGEVLYHFLKRSGYLLQLTKKESLENEGRLKNIAYFFERVQEFSRIQENDRVSEFVKYLNLLKEAGDDPERVEYDEALDVANILTIHKAKGLEFPVVFIISLVAEKFPVRSKKHPIELPEALAKDILPSGDFHLQEERRLFYVGMTRAKDKLYLTSSADYGGKRKRKISPFVLEALDKPKADVDMDSLSAFEQIGLFAPKDKKQIVVASKSKKNKIIALSFTQINDYLNCPLKYKYVHILKIPLLPNHAIIYGSALHRAVQAYHQAKMNKKSFSKNDLINAFKRNWSSEGFISREHEEKRFAVGKKALSDYFRKEGKNRWIPKFVEKGFNFVQDDIKIRGFWDRVDERNSKVFIIDFKSSEVKDRTEAQKRTNKSFQLSVYALAWFNMFGELPYRVALYFIERNIVGESKRTKADLEKAWETIVRIADGIRNEEFPALPNKIKCSYCAYYEICPRKM